MSQVNATLPSAIADRITKPFSRFLKIETASGAVLLLATFGALILSNSAWSASFLAFWEVPVGVHFGSLDFTRSLRHWIDDGLMTLFFFVVALELKRELVLGELRTLRMATLSCAGALGGVLGPATIYLALTRGQPEMHGWGTVTATDTAFVIGCLALLGSRIPPSLRLFLLSLAIFDDVGAILVVALGYGGPLNYAALVLMGLGLVIMVGFARVGIRNVSIYFLLGVMIWLCCDASGVHPTFTGVVLGLMTPPRGWVSDARLHAILEQVVSYPSGNRWSGDTIARRDLRRASIATAEALSPLERLEMMLHPWVGFAIMPIFAFANAGFAISGPDIVQPVSLAIFASLAFGKPIGVLAFSWLAVRLGIATRSPGLNWSLLAAASLLTGIGFTMSLFIAGMAYEPAVLDAVKIGILAASVFSATAGLLVLFILTSRSAGMLKRSSI
jgi:NhaA family Na+:H+ antiporter